MDMSATWGVVRKHIFLVFVGDLCWCWFTLLNVDFLPKLWIVSLALDAGSEHHPFLSLRTFKI